VRVHQRPRLPESVEELSKHNIDHVTITINCVDPDVGAKIYPWIFWNNKRIMGREGAAILIEQQQKGLEMLTARGILVKVNSVMIPGVNDEHLEGSVESGQGQGRVPAQRHAADCRAGARHLLRTDGAVRPDP
jgi:MoaA/NifB/PqqE/SkfB family radical SAM enzyme